MPPIPARMLATVYHWESGLQVKEVTMPRPGFDEVLIQVDSCGICASDLKFIHNLVDQRVGEGRILGHEFSGTVVEVGPAVSGVAVGDPVAVDPVMSCGSCYECRRGNPHYCLHKQTIGFSRPGAFAQYVTAHVSSVHPIPAGLPLESGALAEPLACALHAVEASGARPGDAAAVIGTGSIGLLMVQLFKKQGVAVIGLDQQPERLQLARDLGADEVVDVRTVDPVEKVQAWAGGRGVDAVVDAVGHPEVMMQAIRMGAPGSTVVLFGVPAGDEVITVPHQALITRGQRLAGCTGTPFLFPRALELLARGDVRVEPLITHRYGLEGLSQAVALLEQRAKGAIKVLIQPFRQN